MRDRRLKVATIQLEATTDRAFNLRKCEEYLQEATAQGAKLCVLPEMFARLGTMAETMAYPETLEGELCSWGSRWAKRLGVHLVMGSFPESEWREEIHTTDNFQNESSTTAEVVDKTLPYNTACLFDPSGSLLGAYRKIHLFDCDLEGARCMESDFTRAGCQIATYKLDNYWHLGLAICYDLRFPDMFGRMKKRGANIVVLPAAFTAETGKDHWEILVRARAVETQSYIIAANQCGGQGVRRHGHSMIVDPWGTIVAQIGNRPGIAVAELDGEYLELVRRTFPFG